MTFLLGIDLGATFIKGAILDLERLSLSHILRVSFPSFTEHSDPAIKEVPAQQILKAFHTVVRQLLEKNSEARGLFLCAQMHGIIFVDGNGQALSPYVSWQDQRSLQSSPGQAGSYFDGINSRIGNLKYEAGGELRPSLPLCTMHVLAMQKNLPQDVYPASLTDFLLANLLQVPPVTDTTNAAATGVFDVRNGIWHAKIISLLQLKQLRWPRIVEPGTLLGTCVFEGRQLELYAGIGDQQAALLGCDLAENELSLNVATGSQVSRLVSTLTLGNVQTRPYPGGRWLRTVTHLPAGRALNMLLAVFAELSDVENVEDVWKKVLERVDAAPVTDVQVNLCFFESAIGNRGAIDNLHSGNIFVGHIFRAAFENMATAYDTTANRIWPERTWERLVFSGGLLSKIEVLRKAVLQRMGTEFRTCDSGEDTLEGLLRLAAFFGLK